LTVLVKEKNLEKGRTGEKLQNQGTKGTEKKGKRKGIL